MEITVVKRDGSKEPFVVEKVVVSCLKAGAPPDVARKIGKIIEGRLLDQGAREVSAKELTKMILELLKRENEEWYRNWILFDRIVKRRRTDVEIGEKKE